MSDRWNFVGPLVGWAEFMFCILAVCIWYRIGISKHSADGALHASLMVGELGHVTDYRPPIIGVQGSTPGPQQMPTTRVEGIVLPSQEFMSAGIVLGSKTQPPPGVVQKAQLNSIEPRTCFKYDLLPGESIVKTYDVHMPGQLMPRWAFWLLTCITIGIFYLYWTCYRWCLQMGYCTMPIIAMNRGKMAITSTDRVLVWKTNFKQARMGSSSCCCCCCCRECADPINWQSHTFSRTYNISNINDVELRLCQQKGIPPGICCCTEEYTSSVRVRFGDFRQEQLSLADDINWVDIVSERIDETNKDVENPDFKDSYQGLSGIARALTTLIVEKRAAVWKVPSDKAGLMMPHQCRVDDLNAFAAQDLVKEDSCAAPDNYVPLAPGEEIIATTADKYFVTFREKVKVVLWLGCFVHLLVLFVICFSFALSFDQNSVGISVVVIVIVVDVVGCCSCVVIACYLLWLHYHFLSLLVVLGLACMVALCATLSGYSLILWSSFLVLGSFLKLSSIIIELRAKLQSRKGYILTSHRIVYVSVWRKDTFWSVFCPSAILCCFPTQQEVVIRSLFPKSVVSGVIECRKRNLSGMIFTDAGAIAMHFDLTDELSAADVMRAESRITKRLGFLKALASVKSRCVVVDSAAATVDANCSYDEFEKRVLPQLDGEGLITRYTGKIHGDSCNKTCMRGCCTTRRTWHPACCLFWTCGINPFVSKTSVLVSDATVYALKSDENEPYCSPGGFCHTWVKRSDWSIYWTPLTGLTGVEVSSVLTGTDTFWSRCCYGKWCGNNCCPMLHSEVTLSLLCNGVTVQAKDISRFESIRDKPEIVAFRKRMSQVQALMMVATSEQLHVPERMRHTPPPSYNESLETSSVPRAMVNDEVVAKLAAMGFTRSQIRDAGVAIPGASQYQIVDFLLGMGSGAAGQSRSGVSGPLSYGV